MDENPSGKVDRDGNGHLFPAGVPPLPTDIQQRCVDELKGLLANGDIVWYDVQTGRAVTEQGWPTLRSNGEYRITINLRLHG